MSQDCATFIDPLLLCSPTDSGGERTWLRASVRNMVNGLDQMSIEEDYLDWPRSKGVHIFMVWRKTWIAAQVEGKLQAVQPSTYL
jgi:hypothetical protein